MTLIAAVLNDAPSDPKALLTVASLLTLTGLATAVLVVVNGIRKATGWSRPWFGLVLAVGLSIFVEFSLEPQTVQTGQSWMVRALLAILNGFLVFMTALGGNEAATATQGPALSGSSNLGILPTDGGGGLRITESRPFFQSWFAAPR
jgi:hypothetical protein